MVNEYAEKMSKRVEKLYYSRFECRSEQEVVSNLKELTEIAEEIEMEIFQELTPKAKEIIQEIQKGVIKMASEVSDTGMVKQYLYNGRIRNLPDTVHVIALGNFIGGYMARDNMNEDGEL